MPQTAYSSERSPRNDFHHPYERCDIRKQLIKDEKDKWAEMSPGVTWITVLDPTSRQAVRLEMCPTCQIEIQLGNLFHP